MIITQTPFRLSFLGGNTDFREYFLKNGGLVISATINKYIYCIVKRRFDSLIVVNYSINETVKKVNDLKHELVREALKLLGIKKGLEISFMGDIPSKGTGLGSSSAVTIGVLNALHTYLGESVGAHQLAEEAVKIELDILKKTSGIQDQYAIALGSLRTIEFGKNGKVDSSRIKMSESLKQDLDNSLMLLYTGITRKSTKILSAMDISGNGSILDENKSLANEGKKALVRGDLQKFGEFLNKYWDLKRKLNKKTTNSKIEKMYKLALGAGAIGGKIVGAGGGGFLLLLFPSNRRTAIRQKLSGYKELPFHLTESGSKVIFNIQN